MRPMHGLRGHTHGTEAALQGLTTDQNVDAQINYVRQSLLEARN